MCVRARARLYLSGREGGVSVSASVPMGAWSRWMRLYLWGRGLGECVCTYGGVDSASVYQRGRGLGACVCTYGSVVSVGAFVPVGLWSRCVRLYLWERGLGGCFCTRGVVVSVRASVPMGAWSR